MKPMSQHGLITFLLLVAFCQEIAQAQNGWTTPVRINPSTSLQQDFQVIAIGPQRQIAIACREGNIYGCMAVYRSTDNGTTFLRTLIAAPQVPEFTMNRTEALAFDPDGNLFLLWSWNQEPVVGPRQWLVLSKSTDGGVSFSNIWSNAQFFALNQRKMIITPDRTIHILRDSLIRPFPPPPQDPYKIIYTRFMHGDPVNMVEVVLPQPSDTVYIREYASMMISGSVVHYAANGFIPPNTYQLYYSRSSDGGVSFSPLVQVDTGLAVFPTLARSFNNKAILIYATGEPDPSPHALLMFRFISDSTLTFSPPIRLGSKWMSSDPNAAITLLAESLHNYLIYGGGDTAVGGGTCYYQYSDLQSPPTDSAFFPLLKHPDFALDSLGGKYIVADHQNDFRLYFTKKDVVASVGEESEEPSEAYLYQNFPNPFNPSTRIHFEIPRDGLVQLTLYDMLGREVATLVNEQLKPGKHEATFDGNGLASGVYFYRLRSGEFVQTKKLILLR